LNSLFGIEAKIDQNHKTLEMCALFILHKSLSWKNAKSTVITRIELLWQQTKQAFSVWAVKVTWV